jgi:hypothetical protein
MGLKWPAVLLCASMAMPSSSWACGHGRWPVKTGSDPDSKLIDLQHVIPTDLAEMLSWPKPDYYPPDGRIAPHELEIYTVTAILKWIIPSPDSDLHLNLEDDDGNKIIAEIPDPKCVSDGSPMRSGIATARAAVHEEFGAAELPHHPNIRVQITGPAMWDPPHLQPGAAKNGIEIHPVLDIRFLEDAQ